MSNPLLDTVGLPAFAAIKPRHVEPAIDQVLADNRAGIAALTQQDGAHTWASLVEAMESMQHRLDRVWSPVSHLNAVANNDELRDAYNACLGKLTDYATELGQNRALFDAFESLQERLGDEFDEAQKKLVANTLRDFKLSGVHLDDETRNEVRSLMLELSTLQSKFEENLLDASNAWSYIATDEAELDGVPEQAIARAASEARSRDVEGWWFGLDFPSYFAIAGHAHSESLRKRFYDAWVTRASDQGPHAGKFDNGPIMERILKLRHALARHIGFDNYAAYSLATKMADSTDEVMQFLRDLASRTHGIARADFDELEASAGRSLNAWDVAYYSEIVQKERYLVSDEELRPYFPVERAMAGLFEVTQRLYGVTIEQQPCGATWHPSVELYAVRDKDGDVLGQFFVDLYARDKKRGGAWMDECIGRKRFNDELRTPVAYLVCNFMPPSGSQPGLLTHGEIVTLFHEFGHTLHLLLTKVDYPSISGINGVPWDVVELPSQFMENFVWTDEVLPMISGHFETGEPLPEDVFERLLGTRDFQSGMHMVRQLEFALFDMRIHQEYGNGKSVSAILEEVRNEVSVVPVTPNNRFANGFAHVFGGGYAAGYYSYKWAEVLSADAFSAFEETTTLDSSTGQRFRRAVLEIGGSMDAMQAFVNFRGRKPTLDALLRHTGIEDAA
ncbi:MAG: M3 family metallopeptidase [Gammaproteobacteria bacterium]